MSKRFCVECPRCNGKGEVPLREEFPVLAHVADYLYQHGPRSSTAIHEAIGGDCRVTTTFNNRLEKLRRYGFVSRKKEGREWIYSLTETGRALAQEGARCS